MTGNNRRELSRAKQSNKWISRNLLDPSLSPIGEGVQRQAQVIRVSLFSGSSNVAIEIFTPHAFLRVPFLKCRICAARFNSELTRVDHQNLDTSIDLLKTQIFSY